jgi:hypothetical protein
MDDRDAEELAKRLDQVVGTSYHEARNVRERIRMGATKWALGVAVAIGMVCLIVWIIESHRLPPEGPPAPAKPVIVRILPAPAAPPPAQTPR